jgi:hypothetical protein
MDYWHPDSTRQLIEERLREARAVAAVERLARASRPPRPGLRVTLGDALIRLGSRLLREHLQTGYRRA